MKYHYSSSFVLVIMLAAVVLICGCVGEDATPAGGVSVSDDWQTPTCLGSPVNTDAWEDAPSISPNGNLLYFTKGKDINVDSYESRRTNNGWSSPVPHSFNLNDYPDGAVHSQDDKILYFASIRPGGKGSGDIYIYNRNTGTVSNIGEPINTEYMESEPWISPDGNLLCFASERPGGMGGHDIWCAQKQAGVWNEPYNIGSPVNTDCDETQPFITHDGQEIYFTATNCYGIPGPAIFMSTLSSGKWSSPEPVVTGFVGEPTLTADESELWFVHITLDQSNQLIDADICFTEAK